MGGYEMMPQEFWDELEQRMATRLFATLGEDEQVAQMTSQPPCCNAKARLDKLIATLTKVIRDAQEA